MISGADCNPREGRGDEISEVLPFPHHIPDILLKSCSIARYLFEESRGREEALAGYSPIRLQKANKCVQQYCQIIDCKAQRPQGQSASFDESHITFIS